jgi:uncharacterized protein YdeI (YjbR/CyaY-like superfamily)
MVTGPCQGKEPTGTLPGERPFRRPGRLSTFPRPSSQLVTMPKTDKRIDDYIAKAPDYAKPILTKVRTMVHEAAPDCEETLKWSHPTFVQNGILCGMAAFKEYCTVHFWKSSLIFHEGAPTGDDTGPMDKLTSVKDLPAKSTFARYVKRAIELNASGATVPRAPTKPKKALVMPDTFRTAIDKNAKARRAYEAFSPSHQREYIEWITDAKQDATRDRRIAQAVEWLAEGKPRNWKYMKTE